MNKNLYKPFILLSFFLIEFVYSNAQPPSVYWERFYGGSKVDFLGYIQKTFDNGFIIGGHGQSSDGDLTVVMNGGASDFELIKLDSCGNRKWGKLIGGNFLEYLYSISETTEHGFLLTGYTTSTNLTNGFHGGVVDAVVCKVDINGSLQWMKTFGGSLNDYFFKALSLPDSSCLVVGSTNSINGDGNPSGTNGGWVMKLDKNGNIIWKKFPGVGGFFDIKSTVDGNFILSGDGVTKIDTAGNLIWQKHLATTLYNIERVNSGGYILAGISPDNFGNNNALAFRIDENGNAIWQKSIGGTAQDIANHVSEMPDNTFVFVGSSTSTDGDVKLNQGLTDGFAFSLDMTGTLLWTKSYGGNFRDEFNGVVSCNDGSIILSGFTASHNGGTNVQQWDFVVIKLREKQTRSIDTISCKPILINNILITHDTTVIDTLKDHCTYDSAYIIHNIIIKPPETVTTINNTTINFLERITLTTTASGSVIWEGTGLSCYTCLSPFTSPTNNSNIYVVKTGSGNCIAKDTVIINVKSTDTLFVPSAFTPNGDGKNDTFNALGIVTEFYMEIFNRWGEKIFKTNSLSNGWDGTVKALPQSTGTFVYIIKYKGQVGGEKKLKGIFTLIR